MSRSPRQSRAHQASREQILEAARALVLKKGHAKLSLREVARNAEFSPAGLYEYFDSKDALIDAVASRAEGHLRSKLLRALAEPRTSARDGITAVLLAYITFARENPEDFALLFSQLRDYRRALTDPVRPGSPWEVVLACVEEAVAAHELHVPTGYPVEAVAYALWAQAHGAATLQTTYLENLDAPFEIADRYNIQALIDGLAWPRAIDGRRLEQPEEAG